MKTSPLPPKKKKVVLTTKNLVLTIKIGLDFLDRLTIVRTLKAKFAKNIFGRFSKCRIKIDEKGEYSILLNF